MLLFSRFPLDDSVDAQMHQFRFNLLSYVRIALFERIALLVRELHSLYSPVIKLSLVRKMIQDGKMDLVRVTDR